MSRPPGSQRADVVDAIAGATAGTAWQRTFALDDLQRLREAGALSGTSIDLHLRSAQREDHLELQGELQGQLLLTCQRCLQPARFEVDEPIALRVVRNESEAAAEAENDFIIADPAHLDLRWVSEEQALLAMPLVPMHESDECPQGTATAADEAKQGIAQSPFANLRDMLKRS